MSKTSSLAWCFSILSKQLTSASSICLRGGRIATVAREASGEAGRETQEYCLAGNFTSLASQKITSYASFRDLKGSINQQLPARPSEVTEETFLLPWAPLEKSNYPRSRGSSLGPHQLFIVWGRATKNKEVPGRFRFTRIPILCDSEEKRREASRKSEEKNAVVSSSCLFSTLVYQHVLFSFFLFSSVTLYIKEYKKAFHVFISYLLI